MIRFNIIGTGFLDVADPSGIGFKKDNQQFRFNEISLGRSTEFSVPATDYNRAILGFSEDPAEWGLMMRVSQACQLIYDGGVKDGTISITSYDGGAFKCCFTIGNASWIDALQNKKLAECVTSLGSVVWDSSTPIVNADAATPSNGVELIQYQHPTYGNPWMVLPSVNVKTYIADILSNLGIPFYTTLDDAYWMIAPTLTGGSHDSFAIASTAMDNATITGQTENFLAVADVDIEWATVLLFQGGAVGGGDNPAKVFEALQDIKITFPSPMSTCYMVQWSRKLSRYKQLAGPDLAGKTINVPKGAKFFFASTPVYWTGYQDTFHPYSFTIEVDADGQMSLGDTWWMRNNAPDMTVFEFLKSVALATGMELLVDGEDGVKIVDGAYGDTTDFEALDKVISVDSVIRNVGSWGNGTKTAKIAFDSDEWVTENITSDYDIDNEQMQDEKTYKTKFSEGNIGGSGIYVEDFDTSSYPYKLNAKKWTLAIALTPGVYLQRVGIPDPIGAEDIAVNSTCTKVKVAAGEAKFFDLPYSRVFTWRGSAYVWTDASWSDGVLTMTLQRVSQPNGGMIGYDKKVAYLESDGGQYINLGIVPDDTTGMKAVCEYVASGMDVAGVMESLQCVIIGASNVASYAYWGNHKNGIPFTSGEISLNYANSRKFHVDEDGGTVYDLALGTLPFSPTTGLVLFGFNHDGTPDGKPTRLSAFKVTRGNTVVLDLIPVRIGSVGYMYDLVGHRIFGNDGTGDFIVGPDV